MLAGFEPFVAYWQELRKDSLLPSREEFHPACVKDYIGRITIVERHDPATFKARLVGTEIVTRLGHEATGEDFLTLMATPEGREENLLLYNAILDHPCGVWGERDVVTDKATYHTVFLMLPICHRAKTADEFFAVFDFDRSLVALSGGKFVRFGTLRSETIIDIGGGIPPAFKSLPSEHL